MYYKTPKCDECVPEVHPENKKAFEVFNIIKNQHIMGFGGPVDLDLKSLEFAMEVVGIKDEDKKDIFNKVYLAYQTSLRKILEKSEQEREMKKK